MKILHLTLKKKWFDLIASGEKKIEYRKVKQHWTSRMMEGTNYKKFDEIHFTNGYGKNVPFMRVEFKSINISFSDFINRCYDLHGEELDGHQYCIHIGKVLEVKR